MIDTLVIAKQLYPGMPNSLDALCRRLGVDNSMRTAHNAILDCRLLAEVYLELMGGKQPGFELGAALAGSAKTTTVGETITWVPRPILVPAHHAAAHVVFVQDRLKDAVWPKPPFINGREAG
jgi:DNA polymerase-3 subunit epsilon